MSREVMHQALDALENDAMQRTFAGGVRISNAANAPAPQAPVGPGASGADSGMPGSAAERPASPKADGPEGGVCARCGAQAFAPVGAGK